MSSITLIGTGNMARTIGTLAVAGGNTVEVMGRDQSKADDLAKTLGEVVESFGFAPLDLGPLSMGRLMQVDGPLTGLHAIQDVSL